MRRIEILKQPKGDWGAYGVGDVLDCDVDAAARLVEEGCARYAEGKECGIGKPARPIERAAMETPEKAAQTGRGSGRPRGRPRKDEAAARATEANPEPAPSVAGDK